MRVKSFLVLLIIMGITVWSGCLMSDKNANNEVNTVISEVVSPDGTYKAVIFERNLGATTQFSYHLSVIPLDESIGTHSGNVYISYHLFDVLWQDESTLFIDNDGTNSKDIFKQEKGIDNILILYSGQKET